MSCVLAVLLAASPQAAPATTPTPLPVSGAPAVIARDLGLTPGEARHAAPQPSRVAAQDALGTDDVLLMSDAPLSADTLSAKSGGTASYAVDLGALGVNVATTNGTVTGVNVSGPTGAAQGTSVLGNSGITTVFVNTGNGVVLQNTVQINVFTELP